MSNFWTISCLASALFVFVVSQRGDDINLEDLITMALNGSDPVLPSPTPVTSARPRGVCPATSLCVPYYLCGDGSLKENELNLDNPDNPCHYLQTCCLLAEVHEERITEAPEVQQKTQSPPSSNPTPTTATHRPFTVKPTVPIPTGSAAKCGMRNKEGLTYRITNALDHEAEYAEFPWMVALFEETDVLGVKSNVFKCGGSLIHPKVVLTAAHCIKKGQMMARAGEWDTQTEHEVIPHQDRRVAETITHEGFHKGGLFNDIALIVLESEFEPADNIGHVCLPKAGMTFDSVQCTASGWGAHKQGGMEQTILKKIDLPIVPRGSCQDLFRMLRKSESYELHESYLCAGGLEGKDTCKGDGGSPLVCPTMVTLEQYVQAGIVSWGRGCGSAQIPGVYADVAVLRDWVDMKMRERKLDTSYYTI